LGSHLQFDSKKAAEDGILIAAVNVKGIKTPDAFQYLYAFVFLFS